MEPQAPDNALAGTEIRFHAGEGLLDFLYFRKWKYAAMTQRDACTNGEITLEAFTAWLEGCFPKRKKRKKAKMEDMLHPD